MTTFTPDFISNLQLNLDNSFGSQWAVAKRSPNHDKHWFQILLLEENYEEPGVFDTKLVYGKRQQLEEKYFNSQQLSFPTAGVKVNDDFVKKEDTQYPTVRFLLQCRKLSQILTHTWLDKTDCIKKEMKTPIKLIRKILDTYNIIPPTCIIDPKTDELKCYEPNDIGGLEFRERLLGIEEELDENITPSRSVELRRRGYYLIKRESLSYASIPLALLLCGQAYYKNQKNGQWEQIGESIYSTYESIWEQALRLSWDTFYASRRDVSQAGAFPSPPYTELTLGYPPKPNEFNLSDAQIEKWVTAKEIKENEDDSYPFYPQKNDSKWDEKQLEYVIPPFPYMPLSCF